MYILLAQRRHIFLEKDFLFVLNFRADCVCSGILFIILYSHWIATNIIQYLLYLVVLVYKYLSVFTQPYLRKWGLLLYQRIMQPFLRNTRTFHGEGVLPYLCMVTRFCGYDSRFCDCRTNLVLTVWCHQIRLTPSFCRKNQFVSITFSSRDTWT